MRKKNMQENEKVLDLEAAIIKDFRMDLFNKVITFELTIIDNEKKSDHVLEFRDFDSILWFEKDINTNKDYDIKKCAYYELTSITIRNFEASSQDRAMKLYSMVYNVALEIWESVIYIKVNNMIVDGVSYRI